MQPITISLFISLFALTGKGQSPLQYLRMGNQAAEKGTWEEAFSYFKDGYSLDSSDFELTIRYADAARHMKNYFLSEKLYAKSYAKDNGLLYPDGLYWLASCQKQNGKYEDAQRNFKTYLKKFKSKGSQALVKRADQEVKSAVWALEYKVKKQEKTPTLLDKSINTEYSETAPFYRNDTLFFSSSKSQKQAINWWIYAKAGEAQAIPIQIEKFNQDIANLTITKENIAYFSSVENGITKIYSAKYRQGILEDIIEMEELNTEGSINTMPYYADLKDGGYLYFVSNRKGGEGGMDIWHARLSRKSKPFPKTFDKPKNVGRIINSPGDELTPFITDHAFFFSSDWHNGFGGQDIFTCEMDGTTLSKRENIGLPINSSANDFYYSQNNHSAYFSSNREGSTTDSDNTTCCNDIYLYPLSNEQEDSALVSKKGFQSLEELNKVLPIVLYFHNDEPNPRTMDTTTTLSYTDAYLSYLNLIPQYIRENTIGLSGQKKEDAETITTDFFELKVKKGIQDLDVFTDLLLKELDAGNSVHITVRGFASPRANTNYNLNLTKRRTMSFVNFLEQDSSGVFLPYIRKEAKNGAYLEFQLLPFGEYKADKSVSDDLIDEKKSIYSRPASLERKIEIESATLIPATSTSHTLKFDNESFDFGRIKSNKIVYHTFQLTNESSESIVITDVMASCGCTTPKLEKKVIPSGEKTSLSVGFDPAGKTGLQQKVIYVFIEGREPYEILIRAEITD